MNNTELVLPSGKKVTIESGKGFHLLNAQRKAKTSEEITFALIAELAEVDGQKIVYEDLLEYDLEDVLALQGEISGKFKSLVPTASSTSPKPQAGNTAK